MKNSRNYQKGWIWKASRKMKKMNQI